MASKRHGIALTDMVVVQDIQAGRCAAIVIAVHPNGEINAAGWTPDGPTRVYYSIKRMDDPGRPAYDSGWRWPDE